MRFICDQMLHRMGKWLRAAGYDTLIVEEQIPDRQILEIALAEKRLLITRDRHFLQMKRTAPLLLYLKNNDLESCIQELTQQHQIDWLYAPFTRCLNCNTPLIQASPNDVKTVIPETIQQQKKLFWFCQHCQQFFWEGSHTGRMLAQLQRWQNELAE